MDPATAVRALLGARPGLVERTAELASVYCRLSRRLHDAGLLIGAGLEASEALPACVWRPDCR